jgi:phosphoribosylaminoimidazole-succinocarboxamide synthase
MAESLESLTLHASGKVREVYEAGDDLLLVATDRISIYDVILPDPIPDLLSIEDVPEEVQGRAMLVRRLDMYPVECVVRGYLSGSGWREYRETGSVCGIGLPSGLSEADRLPRPIFTPATKAEFGEHDENVSFDEAAELIGDRPLMEELRRISIELYEFGARHAAERGIILADTKFEFGSHPGAEVVLGDEVMTPDSSRFWPEDEYEPGRSQPSFDKQFVRDWADATGWDHSPPGPELPEDVITQTRDRYLEAYRRITGEDMGA